MENNKLLLKNQRLEIFIGLMVVSTLYIDLMYKYLHRTLFKTAESIINIIWVCYFIIFVIGIINLVIVKKNLGKGFKISIPLKVAVISIIFYFVFIRNPIGITYNHLYIDKIVISEVKRGEEGYYYEDMIEIEDTKKLYNNLKFSKRRMDYSFGQSTEKLILPIRIEIIYKDKNVDYFYYVPQENTFITAVTMYKVLHYENKNILNQIIDEGLNFEVEK